MKHILIVRQVGRNPERPKARIVGLSTEQRLEIVRRGLCGTLTSVQKDNLILEVTDETNYVRPPDP